MALAASYLVGAIPFGYLTARWARGIDIREHGSGNIGATNVGRVIGRGYGILVLVLDAAKGAGPVFAARLLGSALPEGSPALEAQQEFLTHHLPVLCGLAAIVGHMWPVWIGFRGGKGVATGLGVVLAVFPWQVTLGALAVWCVTVLVTRYVAVASMLAAVAVCAVHLWRTPQPFGAEMISRSAFAFLTAALVIVRHHTNIARLLAGTEHRISLGGRKQAEGAES